MLPGAFFIDTPDKQKSLQDYLKIVLGAFGCGAFMNDPAIVADASKRVLKDYLYAFKNIEYAVYCSPKNDANYQAFHRALAEYCG